MPSPIRRRPYPFDLIVAGSGIMLARDPKGKPALTAIKAQPYSDQPSPGDVNQEEAPPVVELPHAWSDLSLGYGLTVDSPQQQAHKYNFALGVDTAIGGFIMKGPLITTCTPTQRDQTNGITQFVELPNGSLFASNGEFFKQRQSDDPVTGWTTVFDFGVGNHVTNAAVHTSDSGSPAVPTIYAALNGPGGVNTNAQHSPDGVNWTPFPTFTCIDFWVESRQLHRASDINQASFCDAGSDPTVETNWSNADSFRIGDKSFPINQVKVNAVGYAIYLKNDGVYTLDSSGQDWRLYPFFQFGASAEDGHYTWDFGEDTHVTYGNQHVRLTPTVSFGNPHLVIEPIGPERITENMSEVHGRLTAGVGDGSMFAYVGLYNPDTNNSYLLKFSSFVGASLQEGKLEEAQRIDAWHGSISQVFTGKKITAMHRSRIGAFPQHYRCYIGFSDGTIAWFNLPCTPNPVLCAQDGNYLFDNTADGILNFSMFHGGHTAESKTLRGFTTAGTQLTTTEYAMYNYKLANTDLSFSPFVDANNNQVQFNVTPMSRADFQVGTASNLAAIQLQLHNTFTNLSPVVTVPTLHYAVITPVALRYQGMALASDNTTLRDGRPMRRGPQAIRNILKSAANSQTGVQITLPDGSTRIFQMIVYGENIMFSERDRPWTENIPFEIVEYAPTSNAFTPTSVLGIIYNLGPDFISQLAPYSIAQLDRL